MTRHSPSDTDPDELLDHGTTTAEMVATFMQLTRDENLLHTDADFARSRGFEAAIVPAGLSSTWLLRNYAGLTEDPVEIELIFVHPLLVGRPFRIRSTSGPNGAADLVLELLDGTVCVVLRGNHPSAREEEGSQLSDSIEAEAL